MNSSRSRGSFRGGNKSMNGSDLINSGENSAARKWVTTHLMGTSPFFSFFYDGIPSGKIMPGWDRRLNSRRLGKQRTQYEVSYIDQPTGLLVRCVAVVYHDFPVVEWTLYLKNTGNSN